MMGDDPRTHVTEHPLVRGPIIIGVCCREWPLAFGFRPERCGLCGTVPVMTGPVIP